MSRNAYKWLAVLGLAIGWTFAWTYVWQTYLFEQFYLEPGPGLTLFTDERGDLRILWIAAAVGLLLTSIGIFFLVHIRIFGSYSPGWGRVWLVSGTVLTLIGLSLPILYPSTKNLVVDENAETVAMERRWLYAETTESMTFDEIERLNLGVQRRIVRGTQGACQIGMGLSIVRHDRTWLEIPKGFPLEEVAERVGEIAGVPVDFTGRREC